MLNKLGAAVKVILNDLKGIKADVSALQNAPAPAPGEPGTSPDINLIIDKVLARIPAPVPGKDGTSPDVDAVSFKVLGQMPKPKDGKDGKDAEAPAIADIVAAVLAEIPTPKDGARVDVDAIVAMVQTKLPAPKAALLPAPTPKQGKNGKNGVSITKVKLEKGNKLAVWLDGVRRQVGVIEMPRQVAQFTPNSSGGGGRGRQGRDGKDATQLENLRVINKEADFDTQDATTITLTPGLFYQIGASFSTAKKFITQGATFRGLNLATMLTYTGTGSMFTNTNANFDIADIIIDCPNATVFECIGDDTGNPAHRVNAMALQINNCVKLLTSTGAGAQVFDLIQVGNVTGPTVVSFSGTAPSLVLHFSKMAFIGMTAGSTGFDFGSMVSNEIEMDNISMFGDPTAKAISGLPNSGNITAGNLASVSLCSFSAFTNPLNNILESDVRWNFIGNAGLRDSRNAADMFLTGGSETIITGSAGDWQEIGVPSGGGVSWSSDILDRFTLGADGVLTYTGEADIEPTMTGRATVEKVGGGTDILEVRFAVNWTGAASDGGLAKSRAQTQNADPTTVPIGALVALSTGDNLRVIFSNTTGGSNIIASVASVEITD